MRSEKEERLRRGGGSVPLSTGSDREAEEGEEEGDLS
jgi:hypothetical protein